MLLQNLTLHAQYPYRRLGGTTTATDAANLRAQLGVRMCGFAAPFVGGWVKTSSLPGGWRYGSGWLPALAETAGWLANVGPAPLAASGDVSASNLAGGLGGVADLTGSGAVTNADTLWLMLASAALTGAGSADGSTLGGGIELDADLSGLGDASGAINAVAAIVAALAAQGEAVADITALIAAEIDASLTGSGEITADIAASIAAEIFAALDGSGTLSDASLIGALYALAAIAAQGDAAADVSGAVPADADLSGSGAASADVVGAWPMLGDLSGSGSATAAVLSALGNALASLAGSGDASGSFAASTGDLSSDISSTGSVLTTANVGAAVWEALAAAFNDPGTMGAKLNSAASAGDPWGTDVPGAYPAGSAGHKLGTLLDSAVSDVPAAVWAELIEAGFPADRVLRIIAAAVAGKLSGEPGFPVFRNLADDADQITGEADSDGNRTSAEYGG